MAVLIPIEGMSDTVFQAYYECLLDIHGRAYADFILGSPRELEIPVLDEEALQSSYRYQICALCSGSIPQGHREDCTFEHLTDKGANVFFLCGGCQ